MANRKIEEKLEALTLLKGAPRSEAAIALRKALADRANVVAAKAARIASQLELRELTPELVGAFGRFFEKPAETDPQCWAKYELAITLRELGYALSEPFVRGLRHIQMEPVWGGREDTAQTLRAACAAALPQCADLTRDQVLRYLVDALADGSDRVRVDAARSLEHMGGADSALLLRLKARVGDREAHVAGQAFESILRLEREDGLAFVAEFLEYSEDEICAEAALALGASRLPAGLEILTDACQRGRDWSRKQVFLQAISAARQPEGIEFLLNLVRSGQGDAEQALSALALHRESVEICGSVEEAVAHGDLEERFRRLFKR